VLVLIFSYSFIFNIIVEKTAEIWSGDKDKVKETFTSIEKKPN